MESIISQSISGVKGQRLGKLEDTTRVISSHKSTNNTMVNTKVKRTNTMIHKTLHRTLKIEQHEPSKDREETQVLRKGKQFLLH